MKSWEDYATSFDAGLTNLPELPFAAYPVPDMESIFNTHKYTL